MALSQTSSTSQRKYHWAKPAHLGEAVHQDLLAQLRHTGARGGDGQQRLNGPNAGESPASSTLWDNAARKKSIDMVTCHTSKGRHWAET